MNLKQKLKFITSGFSNCGLGDILMCFVFFGEKHAAFKLKDAVFGFLFPR